jgi:hypothetical protein
MHIHNECVDHGYWSFEGVFIGMLHLRSVPSYPSWLARLRSELLPWNQGMDEEVTTTGPLKRSGVPRLTASFFFSRQLTF